MMASEDAFSSAARTFASGAKLASPVKIVPPPKSGSVTKTIELNSATDKGLFRQMASQQSRSLRVICHRTAYSMFDWSSKTGEQQLHEMILYYCAWMELVNQSLVSQNKLTQFFSSVANAVVAIRDAGAALKSGPASNTSLSNLSQQLGYAVESISTCHGEIITTLIDSGRRKTFNSHEILLEVDPPQDLYNFTALYAAACSEIRNTGVKIVDLMKDATETMTSAFHDLDQLTQAYFGFEAKSQKKDMWYAELRYRRTARIHLAMKQAYLITMARLFDRFKKLENARSLVVAKSSRALLTLLPPSIDQKPLLDAAGALNTHLDFCHAIDSLAKTRIFEWRSKSSTAEVNKLLAGGAVKPIVATVKVESLSDTAEAVPSANSIRNFDTYSSSALSALPESDAATSPSPSSTNPAISPSDAAAINASYKPIQFKLDIAPAVITPLASPLVVRTGTLYKQNLIKQWKPHSAVLTRDGYLYLFDSTDDLATSPELLEAIEGQELGFGGSSSFVGDAKSPTSTALPPPALPDYLMNEAAARATRVDDILASVGFDDHASTTVLVKGMEEMVKKMKNSDAKPGEQSVHISADFKVTHAGSVHSQAFELIDQKGWFGGTKTVFKAQSDEDMVDWVCALNNVIDALAHMSN